LHANPLPVQLGAAMSAPHVDVLAATFGVSVANEVLEDVVVGEVLDISTLFEDIQKRIDGSKF
jgi:hypothetical protein